MIRTEGVTLLHWNYFLAVEDDLHRLSRFVEPSEPNFKTYSIELTRILFAAASEVDVVAKQLCEKWNPAAERRNICDYRRTLMAAKPVLARTEVRVPRYGLTLSPWANWTEERNPDWWRAYNDVKHERHEKYPSANLQHTLHAVGALFILLLFFYQQEASTGDLVPNPVLMHLGSPFETDSLFWRHDGGVVYDLNKHT